MRLKERASPAKIPLHNGSLIYSATLKTKYSIRITSVGIFILKPKIYTYPSLSESTAADEGEGACMSATPFNSFLLYLPS